MKVIQMRQISISCIKYLNFNNINSPLAKSTAKMRKKVHIEYYSLV